VDVWGPAPDEYDGPPMSHSNGRRSRILSVTDYPRDFSVAGHVQRCGRGRIVDHLYTSGYGDVRGANLLNVSIPWFPGFLVITGFTTGTRCS
jgi:hypothetical protein